MLDASRCKTFGECRERPQVRNEVQVLGDARRLTLGQLESGSIKPSSGSHARTNINIYIFIILLYSIYLSHVYSISIKENV